MVRRALVYGLYAAAGVAAWTVVQFALGWHESRSDIAAYTAYFGLVFPIVAIVLALRAARRERGGSLAVGTGFAEGAAVTVVFAVAAALFNWAYYLYINPGFNDAGLQVDPFRSALAVLRGSLMVGLLTTIVAALVLRAKPAAAPELP